MTQNEALMADLAEASRIAKTGEVMPLVGGPIGLMWGILITVMMAIQYMILTQTLALPFHSLSFFWLGFVAVGSVGSAILSQKMDKKPGANSLANKVEQYVWIMFSAAMASLAVGVILNLMLGKGGHDIWGFILISGFAGQGLAYGVVAKLTGHKWIHFAAFGSFTLAAITMSFYGQNIIYLMGSFGAFITIVIPSLISMKAER